MSKVSMYAIMALTLLLGATSIHSGDSGESSANGEPLRGRDGLKVFYFGGCYTLVAEPRRIVNSKIFFENHKRIEYHTMSCTFAKGANQSCMRRDGDLFCEGRRLLSIPFGFQPKDQDFLIEASNSIIAMKKDEERKGKEDAAKQKILAIGTCNGAFKLLTNSGLFNKFDACILEGTTSNFSETAHDMLFWPIPFGSYIARAVSSLLYGGKKIVQPINGIEAILNKQIPVLILQSQSDWVVNYNHALKLYLKFKTSGFKNVYLYRPETGGHAQLFSSRDPGIGTLKTLCEAFCIKHGLFKAKGDGSEDPKSILAQYQPEEHVVREELQMLERRSQKRSLMCQAALLGTTALYWLARARK